MLTKLPAGCRITITFYYISDKTGATVALNIRNLIQTITDPSDVDPSGALGQLPPIADDWRTMTDEEIRQYLADQETEAAVEEEEH